MTISIGIRRRGDVGFDDFWLSLLAMNKPVAYSVIPKIGYAADDAARMIFRDHLKTTDSHLLLLDGDATLHPDTLTRLLSRNLPVVSALVFTKTVPPAPTVWRGASGITPDGKYITWKTRADDIVSFLEAEGVGSQVRKAFSESFTQSALVLNESEMSPEARNHVLSRVDNVGFHCTLIRRDVLERIGEPFCEGNEQGVHEDFDFSRRAIEAGFDLYVDKTVISGHITTRAIGAMDFWAWLIALKLDAAEIERMEKLADQQGV